MTLSDLHKLGSSCLKTVRLVSPRPKWTKERMGPAAAQRRHYVDLWRFDAATKRVKDLRELCLACLALTKHIFRLNRLAYTV